MPPQDFIVRVKRRFERADAAEIRRQLAQLLLKKN